MEHLHNIISSCGVFSGTLTDIILKSVSLTIGIAGIATGVCTGTWHNILFGVLGICLYKAIKNEEDK